MNLRLVARNVYDLGPPDARWRDKAACAGSNPKQFFPERGENARLARTICAGCPVQYDCLAYAIYTRQSEGVWGGTIDKERRKIARIVREIGFG